MQPVFGIMHEGKIIMKKLLCITAALILAFGMTVSAGESKVNIIGMSGQKGNLVDLRISLSGNTGIDSLSLDLSYDDSALLMYEVKDAELLEGAYHGYSEEAEGFRLCWTGGGSGNGTLAVITFMITDAAKAGSYPITAASEDVTVTGGFIKVAEAAPGDVTGDGKTDEDDMEYISKATADWKGFSDPGASGDINGDGRVNLLDAIIIARSLRGENGYTVDAVRESIEEILPVEHDCEE